jgi:NADH:ubiquinone oxidoreductase subunit E
MDENVIARITDQFAGEKGSLISILEAVQGKYGYLPEDALRVVAKKTGESMVDIYGVATFYKAFSLKPRGKHLVSVCLGTACHVRQAPKVAEEFVKVLGVESGETTPDKEFTLETVACLGACALGPIVVVDGHYFSQVKPDEVKGILQKAKDGLDKVEIETDETVFPINVSCPRCNRGFADPDHPIDGIPSIHVTASFARKHGSFRFSALYGSYNIVTDHDIPMDTELNFFCPYCHSELFGGAACPSCGAHMIPMLLRGGGVVTICSRRGCKEHFLDLDGVNA